MILAIIFLYLIFRQFNEDKIKCYVYGIVIWTLYCYSITEILSIFYLLTRKMLIVGWGAFDLILAGILIINYGKQIRKIDFETEICKGIKGRRQYVVIALFVFGVLWASLKMIPYNWDSMTYHCARLFHWKQNQSIAHYTTSVTRQISSPVLAAFVNVNVYMISGSGKGILNLLQCMSYLTNAVIVYGITSKLKVSHSRCVLSAVLFLSMPIAFAEAMTTQVDNFAALWLLCFVYILLDFLNREKKITFDKQTWIDVGMLGGTVGFGYLTKSSVCAGMLIFLVWLIVMMFLRRDDWKVILYGGFAGGIIGGIVWPELWRNLRTFHAFASQETGARQLVGTLKPDYVFVNFLKNLTFNLPSVWIYKSSYYIQWTVTKVATVLKVNIDDPSISEDGKIFSVHEAPTYGCDTAINPVIVWLMLVILLLIIVNYKNLRRCVGLKQRQMGYVIASSVSFFVFCVILRWEPYISRYMIAYLALLCPMIGIGLDALNEVSKPKVMQTIIPIIYFMCAVELLGEIIYCGRILPENGADVSYFAFRGDIYEDYEKITQYINETECKNVGIYIGGDSYEYPLTQMIKGDRRIEHVMVENETAIYEDKTFTPDIVVLYESIDPDNLEINGNIYSEVVKVERGSVWKRK